MAFNFLVHLVNPVSGWVVTQVHTIAEDAEEAVSNACAKFGVNETELGQTLKAIPQVLGTAVEEEKPVAEQAIAAEPVPESVPQAVSEAEEVAAKVLAQLPPDVLAAIKSTLGPKG
jgi:hypothetical protein